MWCVTTSMCCVVCVCVLSGLQVYSALALCPSPVELSAVCRVPCSICSKWLLLGTESHSGPQWAGFIDIIRTLILISNVKVHFKFKFGVTHLKTSLKWFHGHWFPAETVPTYTSKSKITLSPLLYFLPFQFFSSSFDTRLPISFLNF